MSEEFQKHEELDSGFQFCKFQSKIGTDCTNNGVGENLPSGVKIRPLTKTRECTFDCTNRSRCTGYIKKNT